MIFQSTRLRLWRLRAERRLQWRKIRHCLILQGGGKRGGTRTFQATSSSDTAKWEVPCGMRENFDQERLLMHGKHLTSPGTSRQAALQVAEEGFLPAGSWSKQCEMGQLTMVVEALDGVVHQGADVNHLAFYCALKKCIALKDLVLGTRVHALATKSGYEANVFLANQIICMYSAHGRLEEAMQVFATVPTPNRHMWASIILAHARHGQPMTGIHLYQQMRRSAVKPHNHVFVAALKACAKAKDLAAGREVHVDVLGSGGMPSTYVGNSLVDMYAKCGSLQDARRVFDNLQTRDVVTWTAMIAGYAQQGLGQEALALYAGMQHEGMTPANHVTFVCLVQACATVGDLHQGKQLHAQIRDRKLETVLEVANCLVNMYSKCGSLEDARRAFEHLPNRDVVTWNSMITGYSQHGLAHEALGLYASMRNEGITPADAVTYVSLLQACGSMLQLEKGIEIHAQISALGLETTHLAVANALIDMYSKCGALEDARRVFDNLLARDVVTWTAMIGGYTEHGLGEEALTLYASMQKECVTPADAITFVCLLQACASVRALHQGKQLHVQIQDKGLDADLVICNCLVDMYAKCGSLDDASRVFEKMQTKDVVTWTAMIAGYAQQGLGEEALTLYACMQQEGITAANEVTLVCLLQACSSVAGLEKGKEIHALLSKNGTEATDLFVSNILIDLYAKCGGMVDAQLVFDALDVKDIVTWNTLIAGYARRGESHLVFQLFERMKQEGVPPDSITFVSLLTVCSHAGLLDEGQKYFEALSSDHGITLTREHYNCMVDLLGRTGQLDKALEMVNRMPFEPHGDMWRSVLGACQKWNSVELGAHAFENAVRLDKHDCAAYFMMSNIYAANQMQEKAKAIHAMRLKSQAWKTPGQSWWTDSKGRRCTFVVADHNRPETQHIHAELLEITVKMRHCH